MSSRVLKRGYRKKSVPILLTLAVVVIVIVSGNIASGGKFLTINNISNILVGAAIPTFTAWGFTFIFAINIVDFSVGAVIMLAATLAGTLGNELGLPAVVGSGIVVGVVLFFINFQVYKITKIPSWIAGMGMTMIYESITLIYSDARLEEGLQVVSLKNEYRILGQSPYIFIVLAVGLLLAYVIYNKTTIGLNIRATGNNEEVARMMGINTKRTLIFAGIIAGFFIGCAGFLTESYAGRVIGVTGLASIATIFQPISAVLLAQVLQKYINFTIAIPIATVFIVAIFNLMTLLGVPSGTWQQVVLGLTVIMFGIIAQRKTQGVVK